MTSVLIVGSGAREHALAGKIRQSRAVARLYVAPGNAGTCDVAENVPVAVTDIDGLVRLVEERNIDLTVIGPEAPLALGLADRLRARGRRVVGPDAAAARIESSKAFAKAIMRRAGVPTARYSVFDESAGAFRHLLESRFPLVVKADGLAAGKGVVVCQDIREARAAVEAIMLERIYGAAGDCVVIEEALSGPESSLLAFVDGERVVPLPLAQDHKRLLDGDEGPNTGGMGAYAPVSLVDSASPAQLTEMLLTPVVRTLAEMGTPYRGVLFAGLMLTADGPRVLEYNCRLGDPETQAILPLLDGDLLPWLEAMAAGRLEGDVPVSDAAAVGVVLAAPGYPEAPVIGTRIEGLESVPEDVLVFHAGTARAEDGGIVTAGGRVLTVVGIGDSLEEARKKAYSAPVWFEGMQRRGDIVPQKTLTPRPPLPYLTGEGEEPDRSFSPSPAGCGRGGRGVRVSKIAVLASGDGSNLQAVMDACADGCIEGEVVVVISHNARARALERARSAGIPGFVVPVENRRDPEARRYHERRLLEVLAPYDPDLIVLAGWMLILSEDVLGRIGCPVLNVHPALLDRAPVLRGAHAVRDALALGLSHTGVSVHIVTPEVDAGPVVASEVVQILPGDDEESLYRRIKAVEHRLLPEAVQTILSSRGHGGVNARHGYRNRYAYSSL